MVHNPALSEEDRLEVARHYRRMLQAVENVLNGKT
jgi:hypothetical protein